MKHTCIRVGELHQGVGGGGMSVGELGDGDGGHHGETLGLFHLYVDILQQLVVKRVGDVKLEENEHNMQL